MRGRGDARLVERTLFSFSKINEKSDQPALFFLSKVKHVSVSRLRCLFFRTPALPDDNCVRRVYLYEGKAAKKKETGKRGIIKRVCSARFSLDKLRFDD